MEVNRAIRCVLRSPSMHDERSFPLIIRIVVLLLLFLVRSTNVPDMLDIMDTSRIMSMCSYNCLV